LIFPDGAIDPPHFYLTHADIAATLVTHGREVPGHFAINESIIRNGPPSPQSPQPPFTQAASANTDSNLTPSTPAPSGSVSSFANDPGAPPAYISESSARYASVAPAVPPTADCPLKPQGKTCLVVVSVAR
jgi:hypothetical protein